MKKKAVITQNLKQHDKPVIGVDLGGSHCSIAIVDKKGNIIARESWLHNPDAGPQPILNRLIEEVKAICAKTGILLQSLGMGLPGNIDSQNGICKFSPNFKGWKDISVSSILSKSLKLPIYLENDVRSAAKGEATFGRGAGLHSFLFVAIGTGIGGGIVLGGSLWHGAHGSAGEIGHMTIDPYGPICNCGNQGCLEALASGPAITAMAASGMLRHRQTILSQMVDSIGEITPKIVARAAKKGDKFSLECWWRAARALSIALAAMATTLDPERIILGGGVAGAGRILFEPLRNEFQKRVRMFNAKGVLIPTKLGKDAGILGAAAIAYEKGQKCNNIC